jgi:hypothetical protein
VENGGLRVEGGGLRVEGGGLRVEGGGLRVEGGGLRVEGGWWTEAPVRGSTVPASFPSSSAFCSSAFFSLRSGL